MNDVQEIIKLINNIKSNKTTKIDFYRDYIKNNYKTNPLLCLELALLLREDVVFKSSLEEINLDEFALIIQELDSDITREQGFDSEDIKVEKKLEGLINALKPKYL